jgi:hypothetical protein
VAPHSVPGGSVVGAEVTALDVEVVLGAALVDGVVVVADGAVDVGATELGDDEHAAAPMAMMTDNTAARTTTAPTLR